MRLKVSGLPQRLLDENKTKIIMFSQTGKGLYLYRVESTPYWSASDIWARDCFIQIAAGNVSQIETLEVQFGDEDIVYHQADIQSWKREAAKRFHLTPDQYTPDDVFLQVPTEPLRTSSLPWLTAVPWNWPGDAVFLRGVVRLFALSLVAGGAAGLHVREIAARPGTGVAAAGNRGP